MKSHDIFQSLPPSVTGGIFQFLYESDKPAYRACMQVLASRRKLRTVILDRKSRDERNVWMRNELTRRSNEDAAVEVLQTWLLGKYQPMICEFLDQLGIPHNGHGLVDTLPAEPAEASLKQAIETLLGKYPQEVVAAYLQLFIEMDIADWPTLRQILQTDPRLSLVPETPAAAGERG